ncbi:hypothetical protein ACTTAL_17505 [Rhodobacter capsulatus]|uniref:hypothetical protein n=1 Tax=Rhodobacter capsulatus TaxID=1061 RepID=UPI0003D30E43|nr:hypothetical protein [Rhodobacter capsulatus]ETD87290.1 hypothetical protein U713_16875 [Rhodobacter capsulatus YW2]
MKEGATKARSEKRQATEIVAYRLDPHEFRAAEAAARASGLRSAGVLARRVLLDHVARPGIDPGLLRDLALMLAAQDPSPMQRDIIARMISHIDEARP